MRHAALTLVLLLLTGSHVRADELTVKIVRGFGPGGPVHGDEYFAGDTVHFRVIAAGLAAADDGELSFHTKYEVRDRDDELIATIFEGEHRHRPMFAGGTSISAGTLAVPANAAGQEIQLVVTITDKLADKQVEARSRIFVAKETAPAPLNVRFALDAEARAVSTGRFVAGDGVYLHFEVANANLRDDDRIACALTFTDAADESTFIAKPLEFAFTGAAAKAAGRVTPAHFRFTVDRALRGTARLKVRVNDGSENHVDIPFEVLPPLDR